MAKQKELDERKQLILHRYNYSQKWRRNWDDKWLRWYKLYRGIVPKLPDDETGRSNLHIPYTYSTVDTVRSKLISVILANRPYISYVPKDANDVQNAKNMETLVDSQLSRTDADTYIKFYNLITDMLIYGACPFEAGWRYEVKTVKRKVPLPALLGIPLGYTEQEIEIPLWDDPDFQPFMIDDLFPDPEGTNIDDCAWVIRRRYITENELKKKEKDGIYKIKDWEDIRAGAQEIAEGKQDRLAAIGASWEQSDSAAIQSRRYELLEMWEDDRVSTLINRAVVIRDEPNPFWHGKKPFGLAKFDPMNGEFYGVSLVEVIEYLQAELNTTRNQRIDAVSIALNRMWKVLKDSGVLPEDLVSRANGIVWVDDMDAVEEINFVPLDASAYQEESIIKNDIQEATGTYNEARGGPSESKRTATENTIREKAVSLRFDVKSKLFEATGLKKLGFFFDWLNQQFIDEKHAVRIKTEGGYEWRNIGPEDIAGTYEYVPSGGALEPTLDSIHYRDNLMMLYDRFRDDPEIKTRELKKRILEAYNIKDTENLLKTEEEMAKEQLIMQELTNPTQQGGVMSIDSLGPTVGGYGGY